MDLTGSKKILLVAGAIMMVVLVVGALVSLLDRGRQTPARAPIPSVSGATSTDAISDAEKLKEIFDYTTDLPEIRSDVIRMAENGITNVEYVQIRSMAAVAYEARLKKQMVDPAVAGQRKPVETVIEPQWVNDQ